MGVNTGGGEGEEGGAEGETRAALRGGKRAEGFFFILVPTMLTIKACVYV